MSTIYDSVMVPKRKRTVQNLSYPSVLSMDMGYLVPFTCQEVLPNDKWDFNVDLLVRLAPQLAPFFAEVNVEVAYYYVPHRIIFPKWEEFIYGGKDGNSDVAKPTIRIDSSNTKPGSLADYLGFPVLEEGRSYDVDALVFRAYNKIYNDWYRDENLVDEVPISTEPGIDTITSISLLKSAWEKDYFTSALPFPQRGPEVTLPLGDYAPIVNINPDNPGSFQYNDNKAPATLFTGEAGNGSSKVFANRDMNNVYISVNPNSLQADLSKASSASIPQFRVAVQLQRWYERNARFGYRGVEATASHFGIRPADYRLDRSEFLYAKKRPIITSEVLQTSSTDSTSPQANMSGHSYTAFSASPRRRVFSEHGYLIGIMRILPRTLYFLGIP